MTVHGQNTINHSEVPAASEHLRKKNGGQRRRSMRVLRGRMRIVALLTGRLVEEREAAAVLDAFDRIRKSLRKPRYYQFKKETRSKGMWSREATPAEPRDTDAARAPTRVGLLQTSALSVKKNS